jgi:hypothetical protein
MSIPRALFPLLSLTAAAGLLVHYQGSSVTPLVGVLAIYGFVNALILAKVHYGTVPYVAVAFDSKCWFRTLGVNAEGNLDFSPFRTMSLEDDDVQDGLREASRAFTAKTDAFQARFFKYLEFDSVSGKQSRQTAGVLESTDTRCA